MQVQRRIAESGLVVEVPAIASLAACTQPPSVSVVIPVHNRPVMASRAVASALAQDGDHRLEIIVVDDASSPALTTDDLGVCEHAVTLIRLDENVGPAAARNRGVEAATGTYVAFLDSDDEWVPRKLTEQLSAMQRRPGMRISVTDYAIQRAGGGEEARANEAVLTFEVMLNGCYQSPGSTMIVERSVFDEVGLFNENLRRLEDWDWLLRSTQSLDVFNVPIPLARIHASAPPPHAATVDALAALEHRLSEWKLSPPQRRKLISALAYERAANSFRNGYRWTGLGWTLRSLQAAFRYRTLRMLKKSHMRFGF